MMKPNPKDSLVTALAVICLLIAVILVMPWFLLLFDGYLDWVWRTTGGWGVRR